MEPPENAIKSVFHGEENEKRALVAATIQVGQELMSRFQGYYIIVKSRININVSSLYSFVAGKQGASLDGLTYTWYFLLGCAKGSSLSLLR